MDIRQRPALDAMEAHRLCLSILMKLRPARRLRLLERASEALGDAPEALDRLDAYLQLAGELSANPRRYDSFHALCETLYRREWLPEGAELPATKMYRDLFKYPERYYRILVGETRLKWQDIREICGQVRRPGWARLWENLFLGLDPEIAAPNRDPAPENGVLELLLTYLEPGDLARIDDLPEPHGTSLPEADSTDLYQAIDFYRGRFGLTKGDLCAYLEVDEKNYDNWRAVWQKSRRGGFVTVPTARLTRKHVLRLARGFGLDLAQARELMTLAGYSLAGLPAEDLDTLRRADGTCLIPKYPVPRGRAVRQKSEK